MLTCSFSVFQIVLCIAAAAFAAPVEEPAPFELKQHSDVDGSYTFTYASEDSSKTETRTPDGAIRGAFSYIDSDGVLQKVQYLADDNGFQAYGTNLPVGSTVPVKETKEVLEATADHFARVDEHQKKVAVAARLHAEFKSLHPELFQEEHHVRFAQPVVVHHVEVPARREFHIRQEVPHQIAHAPVVHHVQPIHHAFEEDEEIKLARALHFAEHDRIKAEHFAAVAAAPRQE